MTEPVGSVHVSERVVVFGVGELQKRRRGSSLAMFTSHSGTPVEGKTPSRCL